MRNSFATLEVRWTLPPSIVILNYFAINIKLETYLQKVNSYDQVCEIDATTTTLGVGHKI